MAQRMALGDHADAQQGRDHGDLGLLGQLKELTLGMAHLHAVPGENEGTLRLVDQFGSSGHSGEFEAAGFVQAGAAELLGVVPVDLGVLHVLADIDQHGAGAAGAGDVERFGQGLAQVTDVGYQVVVLGDRLGDAGDVGLLERVVAEQVGRDLAGNRHNRYRVHHGVGQAGHQVRGAGPTGGQAHADLAGDPGIALGHVHGGLFVPHQDVADRVGRHGVVGRENCAARIPEDEVDALAQQGFPDDLRTSK